MVPSIQPARQRADISKGNGGPATAEQRFAEKVSSEFSSCKEAEEPSRVPLVSESHPSLQRTRLRLVNLFVWALAGLAFLAAVFIWALLLRDLP
jgi:hypothetical protein